VTEEDRAGSGVGRAARCPRHGRIFDRRAASGCPACADEAARLERRGPAPPSRALPLAALLAAVVLAAGLAWAWPRAQGRIRAWRAASAERHAAGEERGPAFAPARGLDPTPFRVQIEALEAVLYRESPPELGDPERVAALAAELAERVMAQPGVGRLAGIGAMQRLMAFSAGAGAEGDAGYAAPDLARPRRAWESLRAELFAPAAWFQRSSPELVQAQRREAPRADVIVRDGLVAWADTLAALAAAGRTEMAAFGEQLVDAAEGSREEAELVRRWQDFARAWDARVARACQGAPPAPPWDDEPHVVQAHQLLGQAAHQLRMATVPNGDFAVPTRWWREQGLDGADAAIAEARGELALAR
jgi:hypothetical protein